MTNKFKSYFLLFRLHSQCQTPMAGYTVPLACWKVWPWLELNCSLRLSCLQHDSCIRVSELPVSTMASKYLPLISRGKVRILKLDKLDVGCRIRVDEGFGSEWGLKTKYNNNNNFDVIWANRSLDLIIIGSVIYCIAFFPQLFRTNRLVTCLLLPSVNNLVCEVVSVSLISTSF